MSILESIYAGKIKPDEQVVSDAPEYREALKSLDKILTVLESELDADLYDMVETAMDLSAQQADYQCLAFFSYGFAMGLELNRESKEIMRRYHLLDSKEDSNGSKIIEFSVYKN